MKTKLLTISLLLITACFSCSKEKEFDPVPYLLLALYAGDNTPYNNCSNTDPVILQPGTHSVTLTNNEEYWLGLGVLAANVNYSITVQEALGQDIRAATLHCIRNHRYTQPAAPFVMGTDYLPDSGSNGNTEIYTIVTTQNTSFDDFVVVFKSTTGGGIITLTKSF